VELVVRLLRNSSGPGDLVLDPFAGSGSTLVAAELTARRAFAVELDPRYCDVVIGRWEQLTGGSATRARRPRRRAPG
jgi:DNA modification methylase